MKKLLLLSFLSLIAMKTLSQSTLLHYTTPANFFEEALPIGNGNLGAMVYGGIEEERLSLNDITLWTGEPDLKVFNPSANKHIKSIREALFNEDYARADSLQQRMQGHNSQNYLPLGTLTMRNKQAGMMPIDGNHYTRALDLGDALAKVNYRNASYDFTREYFASAPDSVIVMRIKSNNGKKLSHILSYHCALPHQVRTEGNEMIIEGYAAYANFPNGFQYDSNRGIHFQTIIRIENADGMVVSHNGDELLLSDFSDAFIIITNVTSFNGSDKDPVKEGKDYRSLARKRMENAKGLGYEALLQRHKNDFKALFSRVNLDLGTTSNEIKAKSTIQQLIDYTDNKEKNPDLEELYFNYGRYLLISSSRTEGVPANLQGLWNEHLYAPWSGNYTANINVEENYWHAETTALPEMHNVLISFIKRLPITGSATAKEYYGIDNAWCLAHNTDIWAMTCPVGYGKDSPSWANWNMGGTWLSTHLWEHYSFSLDRDFLRSVYPVLKGAADFCMAWLIEKDGYLITAPATSPENIYLTDNGYAGTTVYGGFADIAMIKECLTDTRLAALILGESKEYISKLDRTISRLLPYKIGKEGNLQEWFHDWKDQDPKHRHQSHLFGLYPGHQFSFLDETEQNKSLRRACAKTLEIKGDRTTGWSTGWRINLQARLRNGEKAYQTLRTLLSYVTPEGYQGNDRRHGGGTYANLFDAHPPFQIDGNFGGAAGYMEMLVQSELWGDNLSATATLLPALPDAWKAEGKIEGARIRGGYALDFSWKNGVITSIKVHDMRASGKKLSLNIISGKKKWKVSTIPGKVVKLL